MAKKKKRYSRKKAQFSLGVAAGMAPLLSTAYKGWKSGGFNADGGLPEAVSTALFGVDAAGTFEFHRMKRGALPLVMGVLGHKVATKLGINRAISSAGIPYLRI